VGEFAEKRLLEGDELMAEKHRVAPVLMQRNKFDVAMELTHLYYRERLVDNIQQVQEVFTKFYATADIAERMYGDDYARLVPEEIAKLWKARK
jgi:hypothetical protein